MKQNQSFFTSQVTHQKPVHKSKRPRWFTAVLALCFHSPVTSLWKSIRVVAVMFLLSVFSLPGFGQAKASLPLITLSGSGYERGFQHGKQLKAEIAKLYAAWKAGMEKETGRKADSVISAFVAATAFPQVIQQVTPDLWQEIRGLAAGSGQSLEDVLAFQLVDEYWAYLDSVAHIQKHHCSAIGTAAAEGRPTYVAQNIDLEGFRQGYQVVLHILPSRYAPEQYIVSCAGLIGFAGMNRNVGIVVNALLDLKTSATGLPVAFIIRGTLAKENPDDALSFFHDQKHAAGQNYLIGAADSVYDFEASANQVVRFLPSGQPGLVYHTNHSLVNDDLKPWFVPVHQRRRAGTLRKVSTDTRLLALQNRLNGKQKDYSIDLIKATLQSKDDDRFPVCIPYENAEQGFTFSTVIFTLGKRPSAQVTNGSPDSAPFVEYSFSALK